VDATPALAAFDFDGTISRRDTLVPFLARAAGRARFAASWGRIGVSGARGRVALSERDDVKAEMIRLLLAERTESELRSLGERYARDLLSESLRPETVDRVRAHRDRGDTTLIVSASLIYYLEPMAELLGMDGVVGVEPEVRDGVLTGELVRPNVRAEQKVEQLTDWLDAHGRSLESDRMWAYGNTSGDHALLAAARHRFWLGRPNKVPPGAQLLTAGATLT
jgi:phosphatidylglycerophosphatase C